MLQQKNNQTRHTHAPLLIAAQVVEFEFLTPETVGDYCTELGFLQVGWRCARVLNEWEQTAGRVEQAPQPQAISPWAQGCAV